MIRTLLIGLSFFPGIASAYSGPGMAVGLLVLVIGFVVAFFALLFGIIYYPAKKFFSQWVRRKKDNTEV